MQLIGSEREKFLARICRISVVLSLMVAMPAFSKDANLGQMGDQELAKKIDELKSVQLDDIGDAVTIILSPKGKAHLKSDEERLVKWKIQNALLLIEVGKEYTVRLPISLSTDKKTLLIDSANAGAGGAFMVNVPQ